MTRQDVTTDVQQICSWLCLPPSCWPPDHYALLGLPAGEPDIGKIEQNAGQVHERLRSYQLSNPTLATEAMTQLAKAFDCLTNAASKQAYDAAHFPHLPRAASVVHSARPTVIASDTAETEPIPAAPPAPAPAQSPAVWAEPPLAWQGGAALPPVRTGAESPQHPPSLGIPVAAPHLPEPPPVRLPPSPLSGPPRLADGIPVAQPAPGGAPPGQAGPADAPAKTSRFLSSATLPHLGTRRDLLERLWWLRQLTRAWNRAGKYLSKPKRPLAKPTEDAELKRLLFAIDDLVHEAPGLLGKPGQPGYRILALTTEEAVAENFKALDDHHRQALARDWDAGCMLLEEYRQLLMEQIRGHRRLTRWQRLRRAVDALLSVYWLWVLCVLAIVAGLAVLVACFW